MAKTSKVRGVKNVQKKLNEFARKKVPNKLEVAVTEVLIIGMAKAMIYTPIDKGLLINSAFREVRFNNDKAIGIAGYTQSYAQALHDRTDWKGRLNPNAGPRFLERGFEETQEKQMASIKRILKV
jgi:hypothetical protein